jgi:hypothetical protein
VDIQYFNDDPDSPLLSFGTKLNNQETQTELKMVDRRTDHQIIRDDVAELKNSFADTIKTLTDEVKQMTECAKGYQSHLKRGHDI